MLKTTKLKISSFSKESVQEGIDEYTNKGFQIDGRINISTRKGTFYYSVKLIKE